MCLRLPHLPPEGGQSSYEGKKVLFQLIPNHLQQLLQPPALPPLDPVICKPPRFLIESRVFARGLDQEIDPCAAEGGSGTVWLWRPGELV